MLSRLKKQKSEHQKKLLIKATEENKQKGTFFQAISLQQSAGFQELAKAPMFGIQGKGLSSGGRKATSGKLESEPGNRSRSPRVFKVRKMQRPRMENNGLAQQSSPLTITGFIGPVVHPMFYKRNMRKTIDCDRREQTTRTESLEQNLIGIGSHFLQRIKSEDADE